MRMLAMDTTLFVIEDNPECYGAYQDERLVGTFGHMASYSFQSSKHLTVEKGGIVITNDDEVVDKLRRYSGQRNAGINGRKGRITKDAIRYTGIYQLLSEITVDKSLPDEKNMCVIQVEKVPD